ncbi:MAG: peptidoglycan-binding domain-containing protein [Chloroflexota bacterium]
MAASAGPLPLERDPTFAAVLRMRQGEAGTGTRERPVEGRIREWQSTAGNAAVARMLQREAAPGGAQAGGGGGGPAAPAAHSKLQYGATGDEVRDLQQRLNALQATRVPLAIDGVFGRKTQAAVRKYQEAHPPLSIDGDAGPETWAALDKGEAGAGQPGSEAATDDPFELGKAHYAEGRYGRAYDEFTRAYEESGDLVFLFNRAQALRLAGGHREESIKLYEQFIASDVPDDARASAREKLAELRGPAKSVDEQKNVDASWDLFEKGRAFYEAEEYGRAYDEFTKAHEVSGDPALLWNRAQALRRLGGRRAETINIYEQFISKDVPEDKKKAALRDIAELKGPARTSDEKANMSVAEQVFSKAKEHYAAEEYAQAYDEFTKAHELTGDPAYLYNRAQALRLLGGRRDQAIALFEQFIASNVSEDARKAARAHLEDLKGRGRKRAATGQPPA